MKKQHKWARYIPMVGSPVRMPVNEARSLYLKEHQQWIEFGKSCSLREPEYRSY